MKRAAALLVLMGTLPALANEDTQRSAAEARFQASEVQLRCAAALTDLNGLTSVNIAGSGSDYRLIIVVQDLRAKLTARQILGGDVYGGVKVLWSVSNPSAAAPVPAAPPAVAARPAQPAPVLAEPVYTPPTRHYASMAPVEMRRTFWAGPATLSPPRPYYGRLSNCHPSRHSFVASSCARPSISTASSVVGGASCASTAR